MTYEGVLVSHKARQAEVTESARWTGRESCASHRYGSSLAGKISAYQQREGKESKRKNMKQRKSYMGRESE